MIHCYHSRAVSVLASLMILFLLSSCKTKADMRREQEVEQMKQDLSGVKGVKADFENSTEEFKAEIARLNNLIEERAVQNKQQIEEVHKQVTDLTARMQSLEARIAAEQEAEKAERQKLAEKPKASFELGKRLFDDANFDEAAETFRVVAKSKEKPEDAKKALYWWGESYFSGKEYASAAIQFAEFKKEYPKDPLVPQATYRQANAFRNMNKTKEAKLFYSELLEKFPKHPLAKKAKAEMRKLKS